MRSYVGKPDYSQRLFKVLNKPGNIDKEILSPNSYSQCGKTTNLVVQDWIYASMDIV